MTAPALSERTSGGHTGGRLAAIAAALRREVVLAWLALGLVALHVADDSFLHPEPGTSANDHLASGLIPLALLVLAALAYRRGRPGVRASIALLAGALSFVIGTTSAGYETLAVGPSGDDFTGLLAIVAGVALIGVGIVVLWRSRRLDNSPRRRYLRRLALVLGAAVVAQWIVYPVGFSFGITHVMRQSVPAANLGAPYEDVSFTTRDGLELQGWYVPSKNGAAVIAYPGRSGPQAHARMLARHGYGVLLFDRRGEGDSEGASNLLGWGGHKDILAAIDFMQTRRDVDPDKIGGMGFSVGGELMLQAAAENDELAAVVSEGAGTRVFGEEMQDAQGLDKLMLAPLSLVQTTAVAIFSNTAPPPTLTDLAPRIEQPLFLIWAPNGGNKETMNPEYYRLAQGQKQIWAMPTAKHVGGIYDQPKEYERRVVDFFDRALHPLRSTG